MSQEQLEEHTVHDCLAPSARPQSAAENANGTRLKASEKQWAEYYRLMEQSLVENITVRPVPTPPPPRPRTALEREAKHGRCRLQPSHKLKDKRSPVKSPPSTEGIQIVEESGRAMLEEIRHDEVLRLGERRGFHSPARQREEEQAIGLGLILSFIRYRLSVVAAVQRQRSTCSHTPNIV